MVERQPTPKHLWIVGVLTLLWNLGGAYDYLMTQTKNEAYMAKFTPEQLEYFYGFPMWFEFFWAIAIWGSIVGCVLLLLRRCLAVPVFAASFVSVIVTTIYSYGMSNGMEVMGMTGLIFTVAILVIALFLVLYARAMQKRDVLV